MCSLLRWIDRGWKDEKPLLHRGQDTDWQGQVGGHITVERWGRGSLVGAVAGVGEDMELFATFGGRAFHSVCGSKRGFLMLVLPACALGSSVVLRLSSSRLRAQGCGDKLGGGGGSEVRL